MMMRIEVGELGKYATNKEKKFLLSVLVWGLGRASFASELFKN